MLKLCAIEMFALVMLLFRFQAASAKDFCPSASDEDKENFPCCTRKGNSGPVFTDDEELRKAVDDIAEETNLYECGNWNLWKVGLVEDMNSLFKGTELNPKIKNWNVSRVTDMRNMFRAATEFNAGNGNLKLWDTSNVRQMQNMFHGATSYNRKINDWDVSKVTNMKGMFQDATSYNMVMGQWDVGKVKNMANMFKGATSFNLGLAQWDVKNVEDMSSMFEGATSFSKNLCNWGKSLPPDAIVTDAFKDTACPSTSDPNLSAETPGPFCHVCDDSGKDTPTPRPTRKKPPTSSTSTTRAPTLAPAPTPGKPTGVGGGKPTSRLLRQTKA